ncbi:MAG: hypothetical protein GXO88_14550 [Chlorobi bacterium]|nr:hypothetical protein [Chlorobiota bacterium]
MSFLKKDSYYLGAVVGIFLPLTIYGILFLADTIIVESFDKHIVQKPNYLYLLSIIGNVVALRYFYMNSKKEKAGAGILLVTLVVIILYFLNFYS